MINKDKDSGAHFLTVLNIIDFTMLKKNFIF